MRPQPIRHKIARVHATPLRILFVLPPDVPAERLNALRAGFDAMVKDEAVKADFVKANHELALMSGADVNALVERIYSTPKRVIDKALAAIGGAKW